MEMNQANDRKKTVKLNLVMTYPVRWNLWHIMEDYIQNFYDVCGPEYFAEGFFYEYDEDRNQLRLESRKGFSVEWLKYIGVSAKGTGGSRHTAGKFGEGFKIASLCAYRDFDISIHMESRDWMLDVIRMPSKIDGRDVEFLGYDIGERSFSDDAILVLGNIGRDARQIFLEAMECFYYPENPVFGDCIIKRKDYAVYRLNQKEITGREKIFGKVFASMQERAAIPYVPLIFCNHVYEPEKEDDRDRRWFNASDVEEAVAGIVFRLEGEALREVFMAFRPYWLRPDTTVRHGAKWMRLLRRMIWKMAADDVILQKVRPVLKEGYIADMDSDMIKHDRNKYRTALAWFRASKFHGTYKLLPSCFSDLGIDTLYGLCERHDGFHVLHEPDRRQMELIRVLEHMAADVFSDLICYEKLPACKLIVNKETPDAGFARVSDSVTSVRNMLGLRVVHTITEINLRKELFCGQSFPQAMTVYMHELLHQFGTDVSRQFRTAILAMDSRIMECGERLEIYEKEWLDLNQK